MEFSPYKIINNDGDLLEISKGDNAFLIQHRLLENETPDIVLNRMNENLFSQYKNLALLAVKNKRKILFNTVEFKGKKFLTDNETLFNISQLIKHIQPTSFKTADSTFIQLTVDELKQLDFIITKARSDAFIFESNLVNRINDIVYVNETSFLRLQNLAG